MIRRKKWLFCAFFFGTAKLAAAAQDLSDQCIDSLLQAGDRPGKAVLCRYRGLPLELGTDFLKGRGAPGEQRRLEEGVLCAGERKQGDKKYPLLVQLERISSEYVDSEGVVHRSENVFPQYIYAFDKLKSTRRKLLMHEKAPWTSKTAERDTFFRFNRKKNSGILRMKYFYGGRLFAIPYARKIFELDCTEFAVP